MNWGSPSLNGGLREVTSIVHSRKYSLKIHSTVEFLLDKKIVEGRKYCSQNLLFTFIAVEAENVNIGSKIM